MISTFVMCGSVLNMMGREEDGERVREGCGDEEGRLEGDMECVRSRVDVRRILAHSCAHWHHSLYAIVAYLLLLVFLRPCSCHVTSTTSYDGETHLKGSDLAHGKWLANVNH